MASAAELLAELEGQMMDLEDADAFFKGLIYGDSGVGKTAETMAIAQLITPPDKEIIFVDSYEGWVTLQNHPSLRERTRRVQWRNRAQAMTLVDAIEAKVGSFSNVGAIVWDEFSTMADRDLDAVVETYSAKDRSKDPDIATWPDMNASGTRMKRLLDRILKLQDVHLLFVAHVRKDKDSRQIEVISPKFLPKFGGNLREPMHLVAHMTASQKTNSSGESVYERWLQVHPTNLVVAKTRIAGLKVQVTPEVLNTAISEWLKGERESEAQREVEILPVAAAEPSDMIVVE